MSSIDWIILIGTLSSIIVYGVYKSRTSKNKINSDLSEQRSKLRQTLKKETRPLL